MTRVVIDANVLASAAAGHPNSPSHTLLEALTAGQIKAVLCEGILGELQRTLQRPCFATRLTVNARRGVESAVRAAATILPDPEAPPALLRDPRDGYLVALSLAGSAEAIVTGDKDLLEHPGPQPPALPPRAACEHFQSGSPHPATDRPHGP